MKKIKQLIHKIANRNGLIISRIPNTDAPFSAMSGLMNGTENPIIFDVGAHHGSVALSFRKIFPTATVYAFEPFDESFQNLQANTKDDRNIHVFNFGLSNRVGHQKFYCNKASDTNSIFKTDEDAIKTWGKGLLETEKVVEVKFDTIDSTLSTLKIPRIDLLKLDVQGSESLVIAGAADAIGRGLINAIYCEIITQPTYQGQSRFDQALATYYENGFDLYDIYNLSHNTEGRLRVVDAIFTKRNN
jgi:FkbM family methyltransferase